MKVNKVTYDPNLISRKMNACYDATLGDRLGDAFSDIGGMDLCVRRIVGHPDTINKVLTLGLWIDEEDGIRYLWGAKIVEEVNMDQDVLVLIPIGIVPRGPKIIIQLV